MLFLAGVLVINTIYLQVVALNSSESFVTVNHDTNDDYGSCKARDLCVRKCCLEHHVLENRKCVYSDEHDFNVRVYKGVENVSDVVNITLNVIHDDKCYQQRLALIPAFDETQTFFVQTNGSLFWPQNDISKIIPFYHYCLETIIFSEMEQHFAALVCFNESQLLSAKDGKYSWGRFIILELLSTMPAYVYITKSGGMNLKKLLNAEFCSGL